jgi:hypothetical protein
MKTRPADAGSAQDGGFSEYTAYLISNDRLTLAGAGWFVDAPSEQSELRRTSPPHQVPSGIPESFGSIPCYTARWCLGILLGARRARLAVPVVYSVSWKRPPLYSIAAAMVP